ncbi:MAG TPA: M91 family zinc metallopeptidase [Gemmatimonadales bacterium]|nr:M91 family zinc metallopeptidase [Gemmatimonadales bacterium]
MIKRQLNAVMEVQGFSGASLGNGTAMNDKDGKRFCDLVESSLKKLVKLPTGNKIVNAIITKGKPCTIFSGDLANSGAAMPLNQGIQSQIDCTVVYFVPRHKIQTVKQSGDHVGGLNVKLKDSMGKHLAGVGAPTKKGQTAPELKNIMNRARNKLGDITSFLARVTGNSVQDIVDMSEGTKAVDRETFFKISYHLYEFLTPGPGVPVAVRFRPEADIPDHILLGHELIHAWRMIHGKRLVMGGSMYDEEMMTVGLGMFSHWEFTENQLRREAGFASRTKYGTIDVSSAYAASLMQQIEGA